MIFTAALEKPQKYLTS